MSSLKHAVASFLRFLAVGLILLGLAVLAAAWAAGRQGEPAFWRWAGGGLCTLAGLGLLFGSSALARFFTQDYE